MQDPIVQITQCYVALGIAEPTRTLTEKLNSKMCLFYIHK